MAKKQSRRSISVNRSLYDTAKSYAAKTNQPLSQLTENALRVALARAVNPELGVIFDTMLKETREAQPTRIEGKADMGPSNLRSARASNG